MDTAYVVRTPEDMERLGAALAEALLQANPDARWFVALRGGLGAGKTVFVRGFASVLSPGSRVKSPTYTLVNEYRRGRLPLFHFDLYRAETEADLASLGLEDYMAGGTCIVEWSEHLREFPADTVTVTIVPREDGARFVLIPAFSDLSVEKESMT